MISRRSGARSSIGLQASQSSPLEFTLIRQWRSEHRAQVAIFADNEWVSRKLKKAEDSGMLLMMGYDKPAWRYFPRRHISGPVVAYADGHAKMFPDESREKTWKHTGKNWNLS